MQQVRALISVLASGMNTFGARVRYAARAGTWVHVAMISIAFLVIAGTLRFVTSAELNAGPRTLGAVLYAAQSFGVALAIGFAVWGAMRLFQGKAAPEIRDTVLWSAALYGIVLLGFAVVR